jgi:hypothetical protein
VAALAADLWPDNAVGVADDDPLKAVGMNPFNDLLKIGTRGVRVKLDPGLR